MKSYKQTLNVEAATWLIKDEAQRNEKAQRERIRYKKILKDMNLWGKGSLDTSNMTVLDVGCGPLGGVSTLLTANMIVRADPLMEEYKKYFHVDNGISDKAEDIDYAIYDLVIATNCIDHFESPDDFFTQLDSTAKYSTYFAHYHAINNAVTHPHEAHVYNINKEVVYTYLQYDWELVWELDHETDGLTYAWRKQPAFSQLWRKITK